MAQDINTPKYNTTTGLLTDYGRSLGMPEVNAGSNVINSANLAPVNNPIQTVPTPIDNTNYTGVTTGVANGLQSTADANLATTTANQKAQQDINNSTQNAWLALMAQENNLAADKAAANTTAGVDTANQKFNDYSAQIDNYNIQAKQLLAEQGIIPIQTQQNNQNTGATDAGVAPQTAGALRENAIKAYTLSQNAAIAEYGYNNSKAALATAQADAQKIIDLKYLPIENQIATLKQQYEFNKDALTAVSATRTEALAAKIKADETAVADNKATETKIQDLVMKLHEAGASNDVINATSNAKDKNGNPDYNAALIASGSSLAKMTGDFADYPQYKADAIANGVIPKDATSWLKDKQASDAKLKSSEAYGTAFATAKGKAAGEASGSGGSGTLLPVVSNSGITFNVPSSVAPYVKISENGVKYVDASGLTPALKAQVMKDAFNGGKNPIPVITDPANALDVNNITDATLKLKDMRDAFTGQTTESALARDTYYAGAIKMASALQTNPAATGLDIYQDAALDILKAMSGTKGFRGGTSMVDQVKETFPKKTDTTAVVNQKIDNMQKLINDRQTGLIGKPNANDQVIIDAKNAESNLTTNLTNIKTTNPTLWSAASKMFTSLNPTSGQPYSASDILQAFPELGK